MQELDASGAEPLLKFDRVTRVFPVRTAHGELPLKAVNNVSFTVDRGECVGLVGESGCGKSTLGRMVCGLAAPTSGTISFAGAPLPLAAPSSPVIGRLQMVFQDPFSSLNPRMTVGISVAAGPCTRGYKKRSPMGRSEIRERVRDIFARVGLAGMESRYPHEFSGGQRQRVALARAFVTRPDIVVCDEPVSALDASVQAQVLNVMRDLQEEYGQAQLFISHNLAVVGFMCSRVLVMYLGELVEELAADRLHCAAHPYTQALYGAMPSRTPGRGKAMVVLSGELPSPLNPPSGCPFHPRCPRAREICTSTAPDWTELAPGWRVRCHCLEG